PVTDVEYPIQDDTLIVSKTDTKGRLTYFNDQFVAAAGFTEAELIGQPHNIIRHPDMPTEAFEDLWATLKAGKPWAGAVKNRRKNGDFYWVLASATPIWEAGQISGYMSIRSKIPDSQRAEAEHVYALLREKKAGNYTVCGGIIRRRSLTDRFNFFTRTLRARLITLIIAQMAFTAATGCVGILAYDGSEGALIIGAQIVTLVGGLLVGGLLGYQAIGAISRPLKRLIDAMSRIAQGEFNSRIVIERDDEIGTALRNIQAMQNKLGFDREETKDTAGKVAQRRKGDMQQLAHDFEGAVGKIIETVSQASSELEASAAMLSTNAKRSSELTMTVAGASETASTNVQSVASATEQMAASVNEIGRQVQDSARIAQAAVLQAQQTNEQIGQLSKAAARIGDVVELITKIAGQTNLLALNATIEAARAGEAGRGFAVVASEVKALAAQTAGATKEISQQITGIQAATKESVSSIKEIGQIIESMSQIALRIAGAVEEQGNVTHDIACSIQQAAQGTIEVSANIADVQRGADETGTASTLVLSAAQSMSNESNRLKVEVNSFLNTIRAA
ncbi:MAG: methyl-accepting chemotaxis sensory transducer with Pas/Pac sensor, partial [Tardiphaga sp.]|nr:methyl-accepting chemotaxis sensory transducer with Pas/Pac sensor [Tardiphaga sp.]